MMHSKRIGNELYVYRNGELVYKRWYKRGSSAKKSSILLNKGGWPNEWVV